MSKSDNSAQQCGNCNRRISSSQDKVDVYNTRYKKYEYYHASYLGCYESTRPSSKMRPIRNRFKPWLNVDMWDVYTEELVEEIPQE